MRGALDRRVLAAISQVRFYCNAGRGRGRAAGAPPKSPASPGLGHGAGVPAAAPVAPSGAAPGRGRSSGGTPGGSHPIGESGAAAAAVAKGRGKGDSPAKNAAAAGESPPENKPKKVAAASKKPPQQAPAPAPAPAPHKQAPAAMHGSSLAAQAAASEVFSALIQACVGRGLVHEIDYVYSAMQTAHIPANMQTYQTLLQVYIQLGNVQKMDGIYMEMREIRGGQQKPEASPQEKTQASEMLGALINSWHSRGHFVEVDLAYRGVKLSHLSIPTQTYGAVVDSYNRLGDYGAASLVYEELRSAMTGTQPGAPQPAVTPVVQPSVQPPVQPAPVVQPAQPAQPRGVLPGPGVPPPPQTFPGYGPGQYPPQHPGMYQPGYPPAPYQASPVQQWQQPVYSPYYPPQVQPGMLVYDPHTQSYHQAVYPPGYPPGYPGAYPPATGYPVQYQAPHSAPYVPPYAPPPPRPVIPQHPAPVKPAGTGQERPKLEMQPRALELLQKANLLKEAEERASVLKGRPPAPVHPPLQQVSAPMGVHFAPPQYAPPNVHVVPPVARPVGVYPGVQGAWPPRPAVPPAVTGVPVQILKPEVLPKAEVKPVAAKVEAKPPAAVKVAARPAAEAPPVVKPPPPPVVPVAEVKPAIKAPPDGRPAPAVTKPRLPDIKRKAEPRAPAAAEAKAVPAEAEPEPAVEDAAPPAPAAAEAEPPSPARLKLELKEKKGDGAPAKLKLGLKEKKEPAEPKEEATAAGKSQEAPAKVPALKLSVAGRGKGTEEAPELPKSPSLQLGLKKHAKEVEEASPKAEDRPKSPSLRLGLRKQAAEAPKPVEEPDSDSASARESDPASETEAEALKALPSLKRKTARGRGKGIISDDPLASLIGIHTPADALLQQDGLALQGDDGLNLPALPFERRTGHGRGKVIPVLDPAAVAAEQQRLKLMREEAAARAIAILESGLGKSQMSVYLERRKKRFSDQQFTLGELSPRRSEGRAAAPRKTKDSKQKGVVGEIDVDGALEYIAPEEYMSKGDALSEVEEAVKGTLHRHFMLHIDPEAAMEEFGTNPDIDDKPLPTLEESLELAKEELIAQDGIDEKVWEEAVEDVKLRAPQLESLAKRYTGPVKKSARKNNKELHEIVAKLPPFVSPELTAFTKRAMLTLQNNPGWGARDKKLMLNRLVLDAQHAPTSSTS